MKLLLFSPLVMTKLPEKLINPTNSNWRSIKMCFVNTKAPPQLYVESTIRSKRDYKCLITTNIHNGSAGNVRSFRPNEPLHPNETDSWFIPPDVYATLRWLLNYIQGKQTFVEFRGTKSKHSQIQQGVPQGGVLSPLLFNIYLLHKLLFVPPE